MVSNIIISYAVSGVVACGGALGWCACCMSRCHASHVMSCIEHRNYYGTADGFLAVLAASALSDNAARKNKGKGTKGKTETI